MTKVSLEMGSDCNVQRLKHYGAVVREMRSGNFHAMAAPSTVDSPIDALGSEVAQLAKWLEQRFQEFQRLQELTAGISREMLAENVLNRMYDTFSSLIPFDRIGCALLKNNGKTLSAYWARTDYDKIMIRAGYSDKMAGSSLEQILKTGHPRIINDLEDYLLTRPTSRATRLAVAEGIRSSLTCPLIANGKPLGFLFFSSCQKKTYCDMHPEIFLQIAEQVSVLIEKSLLYQEMVDLNAQLNKVKVKLEFQATHDALTGLLNRGAILGFLDKRTSDGTASEPSIALIMADLDHFKSVNDQHGHLAGDEVLRKTAAAMKGAVGEDGLVGRYGGEEFLILLRQMDLPSSSAVAERIRLAVAELKVVQGGVTIRPQISAGVAQHRPDEPSNALIERADRALYRAKDEGRNCFRLAR